MSQSSRLALEASPRSASTARRWVRDTYLAIGRDDLVDSASLGISELVTNAVLHGSAPIHVQMGGTAAHPRVEVHDGSQRLPRQPEPPGEMDLDDPLEALATFGRGMAIIARSSLAWGATATEHGKIVWFEPAEADEEAFVLGVLDEDDHPYATIPRTEETREVRLDGVDLGLLESLRRRYGDLRREVRLLSLSHRDAYPVAEQLTEVFTRYEALFPSSLLHDVLTASAAGQTHANLSAHFPLSASELLATMLDMFELADAFCRVERMLSLERTPEQRALHEWLMNEIITQVDGGPATRWAPQRS